MTPFQQFLERQRIRRATQLKRVLFNQPLNIYRCQESTVGMGQTDRSPIPAHLKSRPNTNIQGKRLKFNWIDKRAPPDEQHTRLKMMEEDTNRSKTVAGTNTRISLFPIDYVRRKTRVNTHQEVTLTAHTPIHSHRSEQHEKKRSINERQSTQRQEMIPSWPSYRLDGSNSSKIVARKSHKTSELSIEGIKKSKVDIHYCKEYEKLVQAYQSKRPYISRKMTTKDRMKKFSEIRKKKSFEIAPWEEFE